jgi:hypothetical protein
MIRLASKKKNRGKNDIDPPMPDLLVASPLQCSGQIAESMSSQDESLPPPCICNLPVQQIVALERLADAASTLNTNCVTSPPVDLHFKSFVDAIITDCALFEPDTPSPNIINNNTDQLKNTQQSNQVILLKSKQKYAFKEYDDGGYFLGLFYNPLPPDH